MILPSTPCRRWIYMPGVKEADSNSAPEPMKTGLPSTVNTSIVLTVLNSASGRRMPASWSNEAEKSAGSNSIVCDALPYLFWTITVTQL